VMDVEGQGAVDAAGLEVTDVDGQAELEVADVDGQAELDEELRQLAAELAALDAAEAVADAVTFARGQVMPAMDDADAADAADLTSPGGDAGVPRAADDEGDS